MIVVTHDHRFSNMTERTLKIEDGRITGIHRLKSKDDDIREREELIFVDEQGNLRIPFEMRQKAGIKRHIRLEMKDSKIIIIPVED